MFVICERVERDAAGALTIITDEGETITIDDIELIELVILQLPVEVKPGRIQAFDGYGVWIGELEAVLDEVAANVEDLMNAMWRMATIARLRGMSLREVANILGVSYQSVANHTS